MLLAHLLLLNINNRGGNIWLTVLLIYLVVLKIPSLASRSKCKKYSLKTNILTCIKYFLALVALKRIFISAMVKPTKMLSGLKADIYPIMSECITCSKILPTKIMACPNCGRQDPTGYEAKREYDFQIILIKSFKRMFGYLAIMVSVAVLTFLLMYSKWVRRMLWVDRPNIRTISLKLSHHWQNNIYEVHISPWWLLGGSQMKEKVTTIQLVSFALVSAIIAMQFFNFHIMY